MTALYINGLWVGALLAKEEQDPSLDQAGSEAASGAVAEHKIQQEPPPGEALTAALPASVAGVDHEFKREPLPGEALTVAQAASEVCAEHDTKQEQPSGPEALAAAQAPSSLGVEHEIKQEPPPSPEELGAPACPITLAKIKWKNLRDTHREKLKKINKTKSGQAQKNIKPWKYMSHMEFLLPYMTNTERDTNVPSPDFSSVLNETPSSVDAEVSRGSDSMPAQKKRKDDEENNDQDDFLVKLLKEVDDNRERRMVQREELRKGIQTPVDSLKAFFDSMYQSTKQMPEFYQRSIKRKLFQLVMDAEDDIANTNYSYSGYYTSNCNSRPSTNQTNYSSEYAPTTPSAQPSGSGLQQARSLEDSMAADNTTQDIADI